MIARLAPGDRRVWITAAVVLGVMGILVLVSLLKPREVVIGSNAVAPRDAGIVVDGGQRLCDSRIRVPNGTQRIRYNIDTRSDPKPAMDLKVRLWESSTHRGTGGEVLTGSRPAVDLPSLQKIDITLDRAVPDTPDGYTMADICLTPRSGTIYPWGRTLQGNADRTPTVDGKKTIPFRISFTFLGKDHVQRSMLAQLGTIFERASMWRAGWVGPWTYWVIFFGVIPLLLYGGVRLLAVAPSLSKRRAGLGVVALTIATAATWALISPTFQAPDESEHFGAVQYFAETGKAVDKAPEPGRIQWSSQEAVAIDATRELTVFERPDARMPWLKAYEKAWQARDKNHGKGLPRNDGGGYHPAVSAHSPAYYALMSPAYLLARNHSPFAQLLAVRWMNAILGGLTALFAFLTVSELLPRRREIAVAGGLMVGFAPMFSFIAGAVNNDNSVNMACAAVVWLCIRGLRRGLTWRLAIALGAVLALAPIFKATGYELFPSTLLAVAFMLWRGRRARDTWIGAVVAAAGFAAVTLVWGEVASSFGRDVLTTPGGTSPTGVAGLTDLRTYLSWMWQVLVPFKLPFLTDLTVMRWPFFDIYIREGFGAFGWYAIKFTQLTYVLILVVCVGTAALGARLAVVDWKAVKTRIPETLFLISVPVVVIFAVEAAYTNLGNVPLDGTPEQGRYVFPAIAAISALASVATLGAGRRRATVVATTFVCLLVGTTIAGMWLTFQSFYT
ncbi:MAG TPA: hypothetical protein VFG42_21985 [Baekduia sp.]|uniref:hypothetical protein n=1 Tax=Baekduia sp. TaxID=2600305 RepID=UPI002D7A1262|nr:hypothetical protein [Baekduia sp.]HET6509484.1 hypothetical protein [Baekduia sp.]